MRAIHRAASWKRVIVAIASTVCARTAMADDLVVRTREHGTWSASVAALQTDTHSQGQSVHIEVRSTGGDVVRCDRYSLSLDLPGGDAFALGTCDPATQATEVRLVDRSRLFDHDEVASRPRAVTLHAVSLAVGTAVGGATDSGGSDVRCSVAVRPFLRDLEHGTTVYLTPGRFVMRTIDVSVAAAAVTDGWVLRSANHAALTVEYDVIDTQRSNSVVIHDRATLSCGATAVASTPSTVNSPNVAATTATAAFTDAADGDGGACRAPTVLHSGVIVHGSTLEARDHFHTSPMCNHNQPAGTGGDVVYALSVTERSVVSVRLFSLEDLEFHMRSSCLAPATELSCTNPNGGMTDVRVLDPGTYFVIVDSDSTAAGEFQLLAVVTPVRTEPAGTPPASADRSCRDVPVITPGTSLTGSTVHARDAFHSAFAQPVHGMTADARWSMGPDKVYALRVPTLGQVNLSLEANYAAGMYLRKTCNQATSEVDTFFVTPHASTTLAPGWYYLVVDGYEQSARGTFTLSTSFGPPANTTTVTPPTTQAPIRDVFKPTVTF